MAEKQKVENEFQKARKLFEAGNEEFKKNNFNDV